MNLKVIVDGTITMANQNKILRGENKDEYTQQKNISFEFNSHEQLMFAANIVYAVIKIFKNIVGSEKGVRILLNTVSNREQLFKPVFNNHCNKIFIFCPVNTKR